LIAFIGNQAIFSDLQKENQIVHYLQLPTVTLPSSKYIFTVMVCYYFKTSLNSLKTTITKHYS